LKMVRSGDVSNLARIDPNAEPWGGTTAMARETIPHHLQDQQYESVLRVGRSGGASRASTLGRGDCDAGETARTTIKTNRGDLLRITSLSLVLIVIVFVGMTTVVVSAHAKTHATLVLNVPFQFTVGDRLLLPGTYSFEQLLDSAPGWYSNDMGIPSSCLRSGRRVNWLACCSTGRVGRRAWRTGRPPMKK